LGILRKASTSNDNIAVRQRFTNNNSAILFVGNYYNEEFIGRITYTHPENGELITIPYSQNEMLWPPLYGVLIPVCKEVYEGLKILHSTSDILGVEKLNGQLKITLHGDRDLAGEIVFEGNNVNKISSSTIDGKSIDMIRHKDRILLSYSHKHKEEILLTVIIS